MSFILDALRKSENERQRHAGPTLAAAPRSLRPSRRPWLLPGIGLLLVLNLLGVIALWIWRDAAEPDAAAASAGAVEAQAAPPPAPPAVQARLSPPPERLIRPLVEEAVTPAAELETIAAPEAPPAGLLPPVNTARRPEMRAAASTTPAPRGTPSAAAAHPRFAAPAVPTLDQMAPEVTAGLPPLNLDLHVYLADAARRFVFINGTRYIEGAALKEGPLVEYITPDGAILKHRGVRFLLERP